ncbi:MAG: putative enzyme related to lactoylglutathione lyase [Verrucomicrobiales bacterium]|jgi:predicted enzyme related to lactoylglutathione lyase
MGKYGYNPGDFGWVEMYTTNPEADLKFYADISGWELKGEGMPGSFIFGKTDEMLGSFTSLPEGETQPRWMPYITVEDIKATVAKAVETGGSIVKEPFELPDGHGWLAVIKDPAGAITGLCEWPKPS